MIPLEKDTLVVTVSEEEDGVRTITVKTAEEEFEVEARGADEVEVQARAGVEMGDEMHGEAMVSAEFERLEAVRYSDHGDRA